MENVVGMKVGKRENNVNTSKNPQIAYHSCPFQPVAVYDGCGIVAFVYWLRLKKYLTTSLELGTEEGQRQDPLKNKIFDIHSIGIMTTLKVLISICHVTGRISHTFPSYIIFISLHSALILIVILIS